MPCRVGECSARVGGGFLQLARLRFFIRADVADVYRCVGAGADVNARDSFGDTPLNEAARNSKKPAVIAALLKAGAHVNAKNKRGRTPLQWAMESRERIPAIVDLRKEALEQNKRVEAEQRLRAKSCENWNIEAFFEHVGVGDVTRCLGTKDPNARDGLGETPLHKSVAYNNKLAVINALLKAGARANAKNELGNTPLHDAVLSNEDPAVITTLLKAGADVNARKKLE